MAGQVSVERGASRPGERGDGRPGEREAGSWSARRAGSGEMVGQGSWKRRDDRPVEWEAKR